MQNKLFGIISLSRKAGRLINGFDAVKESVDGGEAQLVVYAQDVSERTKRSMDRVIENCGRLLPALVTELSMFDYGRICGKPTGVLAITDRGLAETAAKLITTDNETAIMEE